MNEVVGAEVVVVGGCVVEGAVVDVGDGTVPDVVDVGVGIVLDDAVVVVLPGLELELELDVVVVATEDVGLTVLRAVPDPSRQGSNEVAGAHETMEAVAMPDALAAAACASRYLRRASGC